MKLFEHTFGEYYFVSTKYAGRRLVRSNLRRNGSSVHTYFLFKFYSNSNKSISVIDRIFIQRDYATGTFPQHTPTHI